MKQRLAYFLLGIAFATTGALFLWPNPVIVQDVRIVASGHRPPGGPDHPLPPMKPQDAPQSVDPLPPGNDTGGGSVRPEERVCLAPGVYDFSLQGGMSAGSLSIPYEGTGALTLWPDGSMDLSVDLTGHAMPAQVEKKWPRVEGGLDLTYGADGLDWLLWGGVNIQKGNLDAHGQIGYGSDGWEVGLGIKAGLW